MAEAADSVQERLARGEDVPLAELGPEEAGLTSRTALVILYGAFILMPASLYLRLVAGQTMLGPISFIALILWVEFCRFTDKPLSKAEAFIVYSVSSIAAGQYLFYNYALFPAYFRTCDMTHQIKTTVETAAGPVVKSFSELAPAWWAPPEEVISLRTFFHASWLLPISIAVLVWIFHVMADVSMAIIGRELFIKVERLPFPFARPSAAACAALTEGRKEHMKVFTVTGLIGTAWGLLVYWPVAMGKKIVNYPIPWVDLNYKVHGAVRGASFGMATDILAFTGGFIVPFRVIASMFLGAIVIQVGNPIMIKMGHFKRFVEGMPIAQIRVNEVDVWASPLIGAMVAAGVLHILSNPKQLMRAFTGLSASARAAREAAAGPGEEEGRTISFTWLLLIFLGSVLGCVVLFKVLIPDFPLWFIAPFALVWSVLFSMIDIRAVGTTGFRVDPPYVREGLIIGYNRISGYANPSVWFAPWPVALGASDWVQNFKICELVRCRARDYIKAAVVAVPVGMIANFVYMSIFWRIAPIPSSTYPFANIFLPRMTRFFCGLMATTVKTSGEIGTTAASMFKLNWILATFGIFVLIHVFFEILLPAVWPKTKGKGPSLIGLAVGMWMPLPFALSLMVGGLVSKGAGERWARITLLAATLVMLTCTAVWGPSFLLIGAILGVATFLSHMLHKRVGPEWLSQNKNILVAGLAVGEGVVIGIFAALAALKNSLVSLPY